MRSTVRGIRPGNSFGHNFKRLLAEKNYTKKLNFSTITPRFSQAKN
jgi:hypothetical protein